MRAVNKYISMFLGTGAVICFTALICVVLLQVFARFLLPTSPSWTEEASRFLFIYAVAFAAPVALLRRDYVGVDIIVKKLSETKQRVLDKGIYFLLVFFFGVIAYEGLTFARLGTIQTSPAMQLPMVIPYSSISFCTFFIALFALTTLLVRNKK